MKYLTVAEMAKLWNKSERTVRNYCAKGLIKDCYLQNKKYYIAEIENVPAKKKKSKTALLQRLKMEKTTGIHGGIYHQLQVDMTYNSNHIEGSKLSHEQTRYIFETNMIGFENTQINVDDIVESANHFRCIDMVIEKSGSKLSESFIKNLHATLKNGTSDSRKEWFCVGGYKKLPNQVGGKNTTHPRGVSGEISNLIAEYNKKEKIEFEDIIDFHHAFECIHPFQDGNGRIGRLIMLKQCLENGFPPFIIGENHKYFYYRGLSEYQNEKGFLIETCKSAQDNFREIMKYYEI